MRKPSMMRAKADVDHITEAFENLTGVHYVEGARAEEKYVFNSAQTRRRPLERSPSWGEFRRRLERTCVETDWECKCVFDLRDTKYVLNADVSE